MGAASGEKSVLSTGEHLAFLIEREGIEIHFHAVTSVRRAYVVGVEALSRGVSLDGKLIAPLALFEEARRLNLTCELDRACQRAAFKAFAPLHQADPNLMLFVNIHADCIPDALKGDAGFMAFAREFNIAPRCVVVEILETALEDTIELRDAIASYKKHGFLVALDDVGAGHSSLNRILFVRPDILKADRSLIENIENDFYKQEVFKAVLQMGEKLGGWVVTEGVEKQNEALIALGLGADLFQGFYFNRPHKMNGQTAEAAQITTHNLQQDVGHVRETALCFKQQTLDKIRTDRQERTDRRSLSLSVAATMQSRLDATPRPESGDMDTPFLKTLLRDAITPYPVIESASLLDQNGIQITQTILHPYPQDARKTVMYPPPPLGTSHALKEYFYVLMETRLDRYETPPYVPLPTGDMCITVSVRLMWAEMPLVLCLHLFVSHPAPSPKSPPPLD